MCGLDRAQRDGRAQDDVSRGHLARPQDPPGFDSGICRDAAAHRRRVGRKTVDDSLAIIQDEADYLTNLVNALLDAAQLERGKLPLQLSETRVDELARRMVDRFQALQEMHRWATEFPPDWRRSPADAERIREVLQNLIGNAAKYSPRGTCITVGGWVEPERVGIFVRDEGPGIRWKSRRASLSGFTRGRGRSSQRTQGAGLGLYLCRAIIEQHAGKIWAENLQHGSAFYFTLPRERAET